MIRGSTRFFTLFTALSLSLLPACARLFPTEPPPTPTSLPTPEPIYRETFEALWQTIQDNYVYSDFGGADWQAAHDTYTLQVSLINDDESFADLMKEMVALLPAEDVILQTRLERLEAETSNTANYEGIGAFVAFRTEPEPHVVLLAIVPGSPAEQAGLQAHDSILAIDGDPVRAEEGLDVVQRVRGPAGSAVVLSVRAPDGRLSEVEVIRGELTAGALLQARTIQGAAPDEEFLYVLFPPVADEALITAFATAMDGVDFPNLDGIILDLRIAAARGGWPLDVLSSLFTGGPLGEFYTRSQIGPFAIEGTDVEGSQSVPLVVLVGRDTGGLPEILASILQSNGRAVVVGGPTDGAIEIFNEYPLPDGSRVFLIASSFRTIDGTEIGLTGVIPNVVVETDWDRVSEEVDPVLEAALEALRGG